MTRDRINEYMEACKAVPKVNCSTEHQKEMFTNAYFAACDIIGGVENTLYDYESDDPEYIAAEEFLGRHSDIVDCIYIEATSSFYGIGFCSGGSRAKEIVKSYRFAGKDWTMNVIEEIVKSMGH